MAISNDTQQPDVTVEWSVDANSLMDFPSHPTWFLLLVVFDLSACFSVWLLNQRKHEKPVWFRWTVAFTVQMDVWLDLAILACFTVEHCCFGRAHECTLDTAVSLPWYVRWASDGVWMFLFAYIRKMALTAPSEARSDWQFFKSDLRVLTPLYVLVLGATVATYYSKSEDVIICPDEIYRPCQIITLAMFFIRLNPIWVLFKGFRYYNYVKEQHVTLHVLEDSFSGVGGHCVVPLIQSVDSADTHSTEVKLSPATSKEKLGAGLTLIPQPHLAGEGVKPPPFYDGGICLVMVSMSLFFTVLCAYVNSYLFNIYKVVFPATVMSVSWASILWATRKQLV